tara:strand:- start:81 stop:407 length:327 start_codon:yes stop_codon:yes gene_type:complete
MEEIAQPVGTAALVAIIMKLLDVIKTQKAKKNGGTLHSKISSLYTRISLVENELSDTREDLKTLIEKTNKFHREFCEFREAVRLNWKEEETRRSVLREVSQNGKAQGL